MADENATPKAPPAPAAEEAAPAAAPAAKSGTLLFVLLCAGVLVAASVAGFLVARTVGGPQQAQAETPGADAPDGAPIVETPGAAPAVPGQKDEFTYYDFETIVVNLDEPRLARYIRVQITLAVPTSEQKAAIEMLERKRPELKNWLTVFFASCTLDQVRGAQNLNRLRREILDAVNQQLWPESKPLVNHVLFKEFAVK
jgi:flagellar basal body-associated protein FliL